MFSVLKKNKTLRSLLGAASLFMAGAPSTVEAAPKPAPSITQTVKADRDSLVQSYRPLCEILEGNLPYCYYGKTGNVTVGCGVHVKDFSGVQNLTALKITPKKKFNLDKKERLLQMANANWKEPKTYGLFPEVEKVEYVKVEDCQGECPKSTATNWDKSLFLMPSDTLKSINDAAIHFHVQNAYECHPNLSQLPPSLRMVVVDLIYNLGKTKYQRTYPKFQGAIRGTDLWVALRECKTNNARRDNAKQILIDSALLSEARCLKKSAPDVCQELRTIMGKKKSVCMKPQQEKCFWTLVDSCVKKDHSWYKSRQQNQLLEMSNKKARK